MPAAPSPSQTRPPSQDERRERLPGQPRLDSNIGRPSSSRTSSRTSSSAGHPQIKSQLPSACVLPARPEAPGADRQNAKNQHSHDPAMIHAAVRLDANGRSRSTPVIPSLDLVLASDSTSPPVPRRVAPPIPPLSNRRPGPTRPPESCPRCRTLAQPSQPQEEKLKPQKDVLTEDLVRALIDGVQSLCQQLGALLEEKKGCDPNKR